MSIENSQIMSYNENIGCNFFKVYHMFYCYIQNSSIKAMKQLDYKRRNNF